MDNNNMYTDVSEAILCQCGSLICTIKVDATFNPKHDDVTNEEVYIDFILHRPRTFWDRLKFVFSSTPLSQGTMTTRTRFKEIADKL